MRNLLALSIIVFSLSSKAAALDVNLKSGTIISGSIHGTVSMISSFGIINIDGPLINSILLGENDRVELADGSIIIGILQNKTISIKMNYGTAVVDVTNIASIVLSKPQKLGSNVVVVLRDGSHAISKAVGGIDFITIPEGDFFMGDISKGADFDEGPVHQVFITSFMMSKREITQRQYSEFALETDKKNTKQWKDCEKEYPVIGVSYQDALNYCSWFGGKYGMPVRLPTEAEWEYSARGGIVGMNFPNSDKLQTTDANISGESVKNVGGYPPNGFGLFDMAGNACEWCLDWYGDKYYESSSNKNPSGPSSGKYRIIRGGGWTGSSLNSRVANRSYSSPTTSNQQLGFRIAMTEDR